MNFPPINSEHNLKTPKDDAQHAVYSRQDSVKTRRRVSYVPATENQAETQTLTFKHITRAQERTRRRQQPVKLEPLVSGNTSNRGYFPGTEQTATLLREMAVIATVSMH